MSRLRNVIADMLVGIVLLLVAWWVLRRVFGLVLWFVNTVAFVILVVALLVIAGRIRGSGGGKVGFRAR